MQPRIRIGLITGVIGLVLNICVSGFLGFCGPVVSLIAGGLIILGQMIGGVGALFFLQSSGAESPFGQIPSLSGDATTQIAYYATGLGTAICFGLVGALLAAGAGYLGTSDQPVAPPPQNIMS